MNTIWIVMPILIVLMFLLGIDLDRTAFAGVRRQPKAVLLGMLGQLVLLPIIAFGVAWALNLPPVYFMGLVLVACCPVGCAAHPVGYGMQLGSVASGWFWECGKAHYRN